MSPSKSISFAAAAAVLLGVVLLSACGGGGGSSTPTTPTTAKGARATIGVVNNSNLGKIVVNSTGRTLYLFQRDSGPKSTCFGACASQWPPLRDASKPVSGTGLTASQVGTTARSDGHRQVTYNGHPLYFFQGDSKPGDTNGQGINAFGASWFAVSPAGAKVSGTGSNGGGGAGY